MTTKLDEVKKYFAPFFKEWGMMPIRNKRLWIDDNGYFLIVAEFQPLRAEAFFFNMAVHFSLVKREDIAYNFYHPDSRILVRKDQLMGAYLYDSPTFEEDLHLLTQQVFEKLQFYRNLRSLDFAIQALRNRRDLLYFQYREKCNENDIYLGILQMLDGDANSAARVFNNRKEQAPISLVLLEHITSKEDFEAFILQGVNDTRKNLSKKYHIPLPSIQDIPSLFGKIVDSTMSFDD